MAINVDRLSLRDLNELEAKLAKAKANAAAAERGKLKDKIDNVLKGTGLTVHDIYGPGRKVRGKSAAKYANPDDRSQTWTGRGRKPNWLLAKLKRGAKMTDFTI